jgi:Protein of unknown function (DUF3551)
MKALLFAAAVIAGAGALASSAQAQNYPWCAVYGGREGGGQNCGFSTFSQCMATLSGMGGFCNRNTQYVPPAGPHRHRYQ